MSLHAIGRRSAKRSNTEEYIALKEEIDVFLGQQDTLSAVVVWILLEALSCLVIPSSQIIAGDDKWFFWIVISVPAGIVGSALIGLSSTLVKWVQDQFDKRATNKKLWTLLSQALGWLGMVGVGLPLILVSLELFTVIAKGHP